MDRGGCVVRRVGIIELGVICEGLMLDGVRLKKEGKWLSIEYEEYRAQNRSLWDTKREGRWWRVRVFKQNRLSSIGKVGPEPGEGGV